MVSRISLKSLRQFAVGKSQHARNVVSFFACRVVAIISFALSVPLFLRGGSKADYGTVTLLFTVFSYISMLDLGIAYAVNLRFTKALARGRANASQIIAGGLPLFIVAGCAVSVLAVFSAKTLSNLLFAVPHHASAIRVLGATGVFVLVSAVLTGVVQAYNRVDFVNYSRLILDLAKAAALLVAAGSVNPVLVAMAVVLAGTIVKTLVDLLTVRTLLGSLTAIRPIIRATDIRLNLAVGLPMVATSLVGVALTTADRIYVSRQMGAEALAAYSIAADVCSKAYFLVGAITGSVYTLLVRRRAAGMDTTPLLTVSLIAVGVVCIVIYLPLLLFARQLLSLWVGQPLASEAAMATRVWSLAAVAYLVFTVYYNFLQAAGKSRILLAANVLAAVGMIVVLVLLPPEVGVAGVAGVVLGVFTLEALGLGIACRLIRR